MYKTYKLKTLEKILSENEYEYRRDSSNSYSFDNRSIINSTMVKHLGEHIELEDLGYDEDERYHYRDNVKGECYFWNKSWIEFDMFKVSEINTLFDDIIKEI